MFECLSDVQYHVVTSMTYCTVTKYLHKVYTRALETRSDHAGWILDFALKDAT